MLRTLSAEQSVLMNVCPGCRHKLDLAPETFGVFSSANELVCPHCGIAIDVMTAYSLAETFGRQPTSSLVHGKGVGTSYARNRNGGTSESYALGGDNGRFKNPVKVAIRPWDLESMAEKSSWRRTVNEKFSRAGLSKGMKEISIALCGDYIVAQAERVEKSSDLISVDDQEADEPVLSTTQDKFLKDFLLDLLAIKQRE